MDWLLFLAGCATLLLLIWSLKNHEITIGRGGSSPVTPGEEPIAFFIIMLFLTILGVWLIYISFNGDE